MISQKHKVKLSPRLQLGVGRRTGSGNFLKYSGYIFLVISAVLAIRAGYMVIHGPGAVETTAEPRVAGAEDTQQLFKKYTVKKGDTVFSIGQQFGIEWTTLATLNNIKPPFDLKIGQEIKVPAQ